MYITTDIQKLITNCKTLGITVDTPREGSMSQRISVFRTLAVLTCKVDDQNQVQYLIGDDILLPQLDSIPKNHMPEDIKTRIVQAYQMANLPNSI